MDTTMYTRQDNCDPFEASTISVLSCAPVTPLLRWAGSKKKLLPLLEKATPKSYDRYIEAFVGSAVLYLKLPATRAILSDINPDLIQAYEQVRQNPEIVWKITSAFKTTDDEYYKVRALAPGNLDAATRAARFIYLNRFCFNGVYRTNRQGQFNVSRGIGGLFIPELAVFQAFAKRLNEAELHCIDFESTVAMAGEGSFCYLDPPYASCEKRDRGEYGPGSFKVVDIDRLVSSIQAASTRGAKVLLSYAADSTLLAKLPGWHIHEISVTRKVAGLASSRRKAQEVLVSNYAW